MAVTTTGSSQSTTVMPDRPVMMPTFAEGCRHVIFLTKSRPGRLAHLPQCTSGTLPSAPPQGMTARPKRNRLRAARPNGSGAGWSAPAVSRGALPFATVSGPLYLDAKDLTGWQGLACHGPVGWVPRLGEA